MRLTLRTLLAYLDHTLEPQDEAILREKVETSAIAGGIIQQIESATANDRLVPPSPDAVGPTTDANVIGEYLDSTLPMESIADVERQCLESPAHLAEVAACHQILAKALGEPAVVTPELRRSIYALGNQENAVANDLPDNKTDVGPDLHATLKAATKVIRKNHGPNSEYEPNDAVGATTTIAASDTDYGGNQNTQRSEKSDGATSSGSQKDSKLQVAKAGDRTRAQLEAIGPLLSGGRPSRVVPYLVTLALMAAFLLIFAKAVQPLFQSERRDSLAQRDDDTAEADDSLQSAEQESLVPPVVPTTEPDATGQPEPAVQPNPTSPEITPSETTPTQAPPAEVPSTNVDQQESPPALTPAPTVAPAAMLDAAEQETPGTNDALDALLPGPRRIGVVQDDGGLLMTQDPETGQWNRVTTSTPVTAGDVFVCGPTFRARITLLQGGELDVVGPAAFRLDQLVDTTSGNGRTFLTVDFGRMTLLATKPELSVSVASPAGSGRLTLPRVSAAAALVVDFQRPAGSDALNPTTSQPLLQLVSVQDTVLWRAANSTNPAESPKDVELATRQWLLVSGSEVIANQSLASAPSWFDPTTNGTNAASTEAKKGLVEFLDGSKPLELQLREAVSFRREDVAALAARSLLSLGMPDVFFGPSGVLNRGEQRQYWPNLIVELREFVDRGPLSAQMVIVAAQQLEGDESSAKVWRLLAGFSPQQLERGGDEELVKMLSDPAMSIRVIASETLRQISGTSLGYRADNEPASRRNANLDRWRARLNRDLIRWSNPLAASDPPSLELPAPPTEANDSPDPVRTP